MKAKTNNQLQFINKSHKHIINQFLKKKKETKNTSFSLEELRRGPSSPCWGPKTVTFNGCACAIAIGSESESENESRRRRGEWRR
jgi:hypothetical protein